MTCSSRYRGGGCKVSQSADRNIRIQVVTRTLVRPEPLKVRGDFIMHEPTLLLRQINIYKTTKLAKKGFQRVTPYSVGRCHEVTEGTGRLALNPLAEGCTREGRAFPEKQYSEQSNAVRTVRITSLGLTDASFINKLFIAVLTL